MFGEWDTIFTTLTFFFFFSGMGKASRWIRNLLIGKKDHSTPSTTTAIVPATPPSQKRRWSFRRSNNPEKAVNHKSCRSFDAQLVSQVLFDYAIQQHNTMVPSRSHPRVVAAIKIQAAFRSYLARKALCALRGLVKLQALVRGHLVRKRTTTMVRCMKALVSIQVRARFQRIQIAEDNAESQSHNVMSKRGLVTAHKRHLSAPQTHHDEITRQFESKTSTSISYQQSSRRFSIDSLPSAHEKSKRLHNKLIDEVSSASTQANEPNYMTRTKSSRAKVRSQSEPRRRPPKQKHENQQASHDGLSVVKKGVRVRTRNHPNDHDDWLAKVRGSSESSADFEFDSASTCTNVSSYCTTLYAYEVSTSILLE